MLAQSDPSAERLPPRMVTSWTEEEAPDSARLEPMPAPPQDPEMAAKLPFTNVMEPHIWLKSGPMPLPRPPPVAVRKPSMARVKVRLEDWTQPMPEELVSAEMIELDPVDRIETVLEVLVNGSGLSIESDWSSICDIESVT
jgi:hypothetical protein